jgi:class 3 adenylate cyclase
VRTLHGQGYRFVAAVEEREHLPVNAALPALPLHGGEEVTHQTALSSPPLVPPLTDPRSISEEAPDGEHKQVTVLCGALAEAPALAVRLEPEAMYHLMRAVLALVQDTVQHYEGMLLQVSDEGFVALFGAPVAQAVRGHGQVVGIAGEPGIGKSRLLAEFRQHLTGQPVQYYEGHCVAYSQATPYLPVLNILRQCCGIADAAGADAAQPRR